MRVSCFRQEDVPTTSDDGPGFEHISRPESSRGAEASGEEGEGEGEGSSGQRERGSGERDDWFLRAQEVSPDCVFLVAKHSIRAPFCVMRNGSQFRFRNAIYSLRFML
mgnify:CR=1 FL=1